MKKVMARAVRVHGDVQVGVQAIGKPLLPSTSAPYGRLNDELRVLTKNLPDEVTSVQVEQLMRSVRILFFSRCTLASDRFWVEIVGKHSAGFAAGC